MHRRFKVLVTLLALAAVVAPLRQAHAAAEVHKLSLMVSAMPTSLAGGDFKEDLDWVNQNLLEARGLNGFDAIGYGWMFQGELRYLVRPNWATHIGVGQLKAQTKREYLPALGTSVQLREEIQTVPISLGASYYMQPYNQGDFQARAYMGGGIMSIVQSRVIQQQYITGADSLGVAGSSSFVNSFETMSPGWFLEGGVHMFFASSFSVLLGVNYRSAKVDNLLYTASPDPALINTPANALHDGQRYQLDLSGIGFKLAVGFGL